MGIWVWHQGTQERELIEPSHSKQRPRMKAPSISGIPGPLCLPFNYVCNPSAKSCFFVCYIYLPELDFDACKQTTLADKLPMFSFCSVALLNVFLHHKCHSHTRWFKNIFKRYSRVISNGASPWFHSLEVTTADRFLCSLQKVLFNLLTALTVKTFLP